ncbi:MAG: hypothetical protein AAB734_02640 [Patescibacteria group bacterium]
MERNQVPFAKAKMPDKSKSLLLMDIEVETTWVSREGITKPEKFIKGDLDTKYEI